MDLFRYLMTKNGHNYLKDDDLFSYKLAKGQGGTYAIFEGTTINANNTRRGKMKLSLKGNTSQTGTPTPDNPIPVNVVSGDNEVVVCGKNLFDKNLLKNISVYNVVLNNNYMGYELHLLPNTTYAIKLYNNNWAGSSSWQYRLFDSSKTSVITLQANFVNSDVSTTFTTDNTGIMYLGELYATSERLTDWLNVVNIQLELGSTATSYEPYQSSTYPIHLGTYELCKIGTYQDKFIRNSGKNIWDEEWEVGEINGTTGAKANTGSAIRSKNYIEVDNTKTYYFYAPSGTIYQYDDSKTYISALFGKANNTFTLASNCKYIMFATATAYGTTYLNNICINVSNPDFNGNYEPYGNGDWYLEKHIGKYTFTGASSEGWNYSSGNTAFNILINGIRKPSNNSEIVGISNYFLGDTANHAVNSSYDYIIGTNTLGYTWLRYNSLTTTDALKTWLSTHNTIVYYILATPTYTKIEGTLKDELNALQGARSYDGQTNINQNNNDLASNMEAQILVNE